MNTGGVAFLLPLSWQPPAPVGAAFTTRRGGFSQPPWDSFNLGVHVDDDPELVAANRQQLLTALGCERVHWLRQVHGTGVVRVDAHTATAPEADASWTTAANQALVIQVADCMPVLVTDKFGTKAGAAHAGWRGLCDGIIPRLFEAMQLDPADALVWLGPCIGPTVFEVGPEVLDAFVTSPAFASVNVHAAFRPGQGDRLFADLQSLAQAQLAQLGCANIAIERRCTHSESDTFYSYRRDGVTGRHGALIWINPH